MSNSSAGPHLIYELICDLIGRDSQAEALFSNISKHYFGSTRVVSKAIKVFAALIACVIIAFCYLICLVQAYNKGREWRSNWLTLVILGIIFTIFVDLSYEPLVIYFGIPTTILKYVRGVQGQLNASVAQHILPTRKDKIIDSFSASKYFFSSHIIAQKLDRVPESSLVLAYSSIYPPCKMESAHTIDSSSLTNSSNQTTNTNNTYTYTLTSYQEYLRKFITAIISSASLVAFFIWMGTLPLAIQRVIVSLPLPLLGSAFGYVITFFLDLPEFVYYPLLTLLSLFVVLSLFKMGVNGYEGMQVLESIEKQNTEYKQQLNTKVETLSASNYKLYVTESISKAQAPEYVKHLVSHDVHDSINRKGRLIQKMLMLNIKNKKLVTLRKKIKYAKEFSREIATELIQTTSSHEVITRHTMAAMSEDLVLWGSFDIVSKMKHMDIIYNDLIETTMIEMLENIAFDIVSKKKHMDIFYNDLIETTMIEMLEDIAYKVFYSITHIKLTKEYSALIAGNLYQEAENRGLIQAVKVHRKTYGISLNDDEFDAHESYHVHGDDADREERDVNLSSDDEHDDNDDDSTHSGERNNDALISLLQMGGFDSDDNEDDDNDNDGRSIHVSFGQDTVHLYNELSRAETEESFKVSTKLSKKESSRLGKLKKNKKKMKQVSLENYEQSQLPWPFNKVKGIPSAGLKVLSLLSSSSSLSKGMTGLSPEKLQATINKDRRLNLNISTSVDGTRGRSRDRISRTRSESPTAGNNGNSSRKKKKKDKENSKLLKTSTAKSKSISLSPSLSPSASESTSLKKSKSSSKNKNKSNSSSTSETSSKNNKKNTKDQKEKDKDKLDRPRSGTATTRINKVFDIFVKPVVAAFQNTPTSTTSTSTSTKKEKKKGKKK